MERNKLYQKKEFFDYREMLHYAAETYNNKIAFRLKKNGNYQDISYIDFKRDVEALGAGLLKLGLENKRVAIISPNRYEWCVSYLAITTANIIAVSYTHLDVYKRQIEYNIPQKEAIRIKTRKEILSEEMRVLYVALTRAKEKLVVIGATKNVEEELEKKRELINVYKENNSKLTPFLVSQYESYLDWITLVWINEEEKMKKLLEMHVYPREEVIKNFEKQEKNRQEHFIETAEKITIDEKIWKQLQSQLNWQYPYEKATKMAGKTSVSKLKQAETLPAERIPKFLLKEDKISSAEKGTLMHLCFQKLNLKEDYTKEEIEELIEKLIIQQIITEEQARVIDRDKIWKFTQSSLDVYKRQLMDLIYILNY